MTTASKSVFEPASTFQLNAPQLQTDSVLFKQSTRVNLELDFPEAEIYYTLDGSEVTRSSIKYIEPLTIRESGILQTKVFHPECKASETRYQFFYEVSNVLDDAIIKVNPLYDHRYAAEGVRSLTDLHKGTPQFQGDNRWLGFKKDTVEININFPNKKRLQSVTLSSLANEPAWIFLPGRIELISNNQRLAHWNKIAIKNTAETGAHFLKLDFPETELEKLTIRILSDQLPEGHDGFGEVSWFFVDEVFIEEIAKPETENR